MCKKTVFHNTYSDGTSDISERVRSCFPGYICPDPCVVEYDRSYDCPRSQAKLTQARDDRLEDYSSPSSSRSVSPASSATYIDNTNQRSRRHRRSEVYVNGHKVSSTSSSSSANKNTNTNTNSNTTTMSQPIPIRRSATMPYGDREPMPERGRRPIIVEPMAPLPPQAVHTPRTSPRPSPGSSHYPLGPSPISRTTTSRPVDIFQHTSAPLSSPRRRTPTRDFHDFREAREARDLRTDFRTGYAEYRTEHRSPTRTERPFSLRRRTSEREPPVAATTIPASSIGRRNSLSTSGTRDFLTPHYRSPTAAGSRRPRADSSPIGYASAEDAAERAERRRRRRNNLDQAAFTPSSVPTFGNTNIYSYSRTGSGLDSGFGSSYESSGYTTASPAGSSITSPTPSSTSASAAAPEVRTSPGAAAAVKKNLRWQDDERRRQNEKISRRPKLSRDETITPANAHAHAKMQGEVKSILKNTTTSGTSSRERSRSQSRSQSRRRDTFNDDARSTTNATIGSSSHIGRRGSFLGDAGDLAGGMSGLNIHGNSPPASPRAPRSPRSSSRSPRSPRSPHHDESEAERARLRDRFDQKPPPAPFVMPARSYTNGGSHRRRTDVWPRDERFI